MYEIIKTHDDRARSKFRSRKNKLTLRNFYRVDRERGGAKEKYKDAKQEAKHMKRCTYDWTQKPETKKKGYRKCKVY